MYECDMIGVGGGGGGSQNPPKTYFTFFERSLIPKLLRSISPRANDNVLSRLTMFLSH